MKKIDRRAARTRRALHEALITLILRKGYDDVTVQDLVDEADVGRSTFYAHYAGKEDLLRGGFERLRADLAELKGASSPDSANTSREPFAFSLALFQHAEGYKDVYRALASGSGGAVAVNQIRDVLAEFVREELPSRQGAAIPRELALQFMLSAFLAVLTWWLERKPELAPSEVENMFRRLIFTGVCESCSAPDG